MNALAKAIVLAAGRGTRMGHLTEDLPKPMLPLAGKPMIGHILDRLRAAGTRQVLIVTGYRAETIEEHLLDYPMEITFKRQQSINGTATAALLGRDFAGTDPFLLTFGDIICDPEDYDGISQRLDRMTAAVLGVKHVDDPWQGAAVYEEQGVVNRIIEKPARGTSTTHWNSAGLYAFQPAIFEYMAAVKPSVRGEYELTTAISDLIAAGRKVLIYSVKGGWRDVGRPEDLRAAEHIVDQNL
jgi:dTDP-glucose pyrophosphorylase